jgi:uncharacterized protein
MTTGQDQVVWMDDLDDEVCWKLIARQQIGRIGFVDDEGPLVLPVNHTVAERTIVIRTGRSSLRETLHDGAPVAFEVDWTDSVGETGWSVLARGRAFGITNPTEEAALARLPLQPWAPGERDQWIRIVPDAMTGRAISRQRQEAGAGAPLPYTPPD